MTVAAAVLPSFVTPRPEVRVPVVPGLWIGSAPAPGPEIGRIFGTLVLCAMEYQPGAEEFPGLAKIIRVRLDDRMPNADEVHAAIRAARRVAGLVFAGERVLVTCMQGRNRSGLVTALALREMYRIGGDEAVAAVRRARGPLALSNPWFVKLVRMYTPGRRAA